MPRENLSKVLLNSQQTLPAQRLSMAKLVLVPGPVGNLGDITLRALEVLKTADFILAEDTRTSANLLRHFDINTPLKPFHQHNEHKVLGAVVRQIQASVMVALMSDAGTPGISDPGFLLVRRCIAEGIEVECLPRHPRTHSCPGCIRITF